MRMLEGTFSLDAGRVIKIILIKIIFIKGSLRTARNLSNIVHCLAVLRLYKYD